MSVMQGCALRRRVTALAAAMACSVAVGADDDMLSLEQALSAAASAAATAEPGLRAWMAQSGRELSLPDCAHLQARAAASLHARWRFYETVLADMRGDVLAERLAMAFGVSERLRVASPAVARDVQDRADIEVLELRAARDRQNIARREARALLAAAVGAPRRMIGEALTPAPAAMRWRAPAAEALDRAAAAAPPGAARELLRLRLERAWLQLEQGQGSARAAATRRFEAAEARIVEIRARLESEARGTEFGLAQAAGVEAQADALRVELQNALLAAWLEASLGEALATER